MYTNNVLAVRFTIKLSKINDKSMKKVYKKNASMWPSYKFVWKYLVLILYNIHKYTSH